LNQWLKKASNIAQLLKKRLNSHPSSRLLPNHSQAGSLKLTDKIKIVGANIVSEHDNRRMVGGVPEAYWKLQVRFG
jgi:hypothetical protein